MLRWENGTIDNGSQSRTNSATADAVLHHAASCKLLHVQSPLQPPCRRFIGNSARQPFSLLALWGFGWLRHCFGAHTSHKAHEQEQAQLLRRNRRKTRNANLAVQGMATLAKPLHGTRKRTIQSIQHGKELAPCCLAVHAASQGFTVTELRWSEVLSKFETHIQLYMVDGCTDGCSLYLMNG